MAKIELVPIFLGGVMKGSGNKPPATVPAKGVWMVGDLARNGRLFDYPILPPPSNFFTEVARAIISAQRLLVAAQLSGADDAQIIELITALTDSVWTDAALRDAGDELTIAAELLAECCAKSGLDAETLIAATRTPEVKQQLIANTELALDAGVFGSPSFLVHDAPGTSEPLLVFGSDRFDQLCHTLDLPWDGPTGIHRSAL